MQQLDSTRHIATTGMTEVTDDADNRTFQEYCSQHGRPGKVTGPDAAETLSAGASDGKIEQIDDTFDIDTCRFDDECRHDTQRYNPHRSATVEPDSNR